MKILLYTDNHFCQFSSILRAQGEKYSVRLENQIASVNWAEDLADKENCEIICTLGDFFDKESLTSQEIAALKEIKWSNRPHYMLVGNHEMGRQDLEYNSAEVFSLIPQCEVINRPKQMLINEHIEIAFLPYILENNREKLESYFPTPLFQGSGRRIILSHNDIKGIQMGAFLSQTGFEIEDIENNCSIFLNGHLHNGEKITEKIYNLGSLTGQNFSEDATKYLHCAFILDTDTLKLTAYENPVAINFYKMDLTKGKPCGKFLLKQNAVLSAKCFAKDLEKIKAWVASEPAILESRVTVEPTFEGEAIEGAEAIETLSVDHIQRFNEYILQTLGTSDVVKEELEEVSK